jgi:hypothetical protein
MSDIRNFITKHKKILIIEDNSLNDILEPYKKSEFIPNNIINILLPLIMPSSEIIHSYSERHMLIKIKIIDLLNAPITNWKYNRPPDQIRCADIAKYIYLSKKPLDTMLYLSFNNNTQSFDIIDGIHRYTSLKILKENNSKPLNLIDPCDYGSNNDAVWLYQSYIILNIRFNAIESELIELFKNLNKSTPISDLYIRDFVKEKREIIENVANNWQVKYKSHFSSNNKPNKPNINRDRFIDLLQEIYLKYNINEDNKHLLEQVLDRANWEISNNIPSKLSETILEKCKSTGCWLFIYPNDKLLKII